MAKEKEVIFFSFINKVKKELIYIHTTRKNCKFEKVENKNNTVTHEKVVITPSQLIGRIRERCTLTENR